MRTVSAAVRRIAVPLLVNLLIGIPTLVAMVCARWYVAHGHCEYDDLGLRDLDQCTYDQIENSGFVRFGLILFGGLVLLLILLFDILRPLAREASLKPRLWTLPAIFLPYTLLVTAG
ncbi:hypothetical protein ACFW2D_37285 [Streptomyces sp. NPDC058914]|uniref:hypothetical protein n=1 Tax=Streptomyces TaxID=1883 RepID=UPI0036B9B959